MRALLTLCLLALPSMAAVAFDATAISTGQTGSNTITWSHTVGSGANRKLYVGVGGYSEVGATVSSVTCGSQSFTPLENFVTGGVRLSYLGSLAAPNAGACTITVTFSATLSGTFDAAVGASTSFSGASQTASVHLHATPDDSGQHPAVPVSIASSGSFIVAFTNQLNFYQDEGWNGDGIPGVSSATVFWPGWGGSTNETYKGPVAAGASGLQWYTFGGVSPVVVAAVVDPPSLSAPRHKVTEGR
jgi:hypothetical protein